MGTETGADIYPYSFPCPNLPGRRTPLIPSPGGAGMAFTDLGSMLMLIDSGQALQQHFP